MYFHWMNHLKRRILHIIIQRSEALFLNQDSGLKKNVEENWVRIHYSFIFSPQIMKIWLKSLLFHSASSEKLSKKILESFCKFRKSKSSFTKLKFVKVISVSLKSFLSNLSTAIFPIRFPISWIFTTSHSWFSFFVATLLRIFFFSRFSNFQ